MFIKRSPIPRAIVASRQCHRLSSIARTHVCRRAYATVSKASTSATPFTVSEISGVKVAARDDGGPTTGLSIVLRAGSRYCPLPGVAHLLAKFAWKDTAKRTAFRVTRETELLGGLLSSSSSRETVSVSAQCLREDIPYFLEALADVALLTNYSDYEFHDNVLHLAQLDYDALQTSPVDLALGAIHSTAFHRGLGSQLLISPQHQIHAEDIKAYANMAYSKANLVLVASGASTEELTPQLEEFWKELPAGQKLQTLPGKFSAGETRIDHRSSQNVYAVSFPGSALYGPNTSPEHVVLAHFLGGSPRIKWASGHSSFAKIAEGVNASLVATNISYSDTGLFTILAVGGPTQASQAASQGVKLLRDIGKGSVSIKPEEVKRAIGSARYATYAASEARLSSLEPIGQAILDTGKVVNLDEVVAGFDKVTPEKLKQTAAKIVESTPSVAAVGQTHLLPFYDEL